MLYLDYAKQTENGYIMNFFFTITDTVTTI